MVSFCRLLLLSLCLFATPALAQEGASPQLSPGGAGVSIPLQSEEHVIRPNDQLELHITALPDLPTTYLVRVDGHFFHPVVGEVKADGRTLSELRTELTTRLAKELRNPKFRLGLKEVARHQVAVLGEAKSQGSYEVPVGATLLDVIAKAGGLTEKADRDQMVLLRGNESLEVSLKPEERGGLTKVRSGDVLYIQAGAPVSVSGEVTEPGVYSISRSQGGPWEAILAAGGAKEEASLARVRLVRATFSEPLHLDLRPNSPTPIPEEAQQLQAGDILVIPPRQVVVLGAVRTPGPMPLRGHETLIDVLPEQIGNDSDIEKILVIRAEDVRHQRDVKEQYNLKDYLEKGTTDIVVPIQDGDLVYVPAKGKEGFNLFRGANILSIIGLARWFF